MRVACLQFGPQLGDFDGNVDRAERCLSSSKLTSDGQTKIDLLVLPEMAFSGYNFPSLEAIRPHLEPTAKGRSSQWALRKAKELDCVVVVGYPEICHPEEVNPRFPSPSHGYSAYGNANGTDSSPEEKHYNSAVIISPSGEILAHYRKSFLYYTDETWAYEGGGFFAGRLPIPSPNNRNQSIDTAMGICMDINNYKFTAPWDAYEFANHVKDSNSKLVVMSNAWLRHDQTVTVNEEEKGQPDMLELSYWVERLRPVWEAETAGSTSGAGAANKIIIVIANRTGIERGATYAGTSTVMSMGGDDDGKVRLWGVLGKGQERCLIVDTDEPPKYVLQTQKRQERNEEDPNE